MPTLSPSPAARAAARRINRSSGRCTPRGSSAVIPKIHINLGSSPTAVSFDFGKELPTALCLSSGERLQDVAVPGTPRPPPNTPRTIAVQTCSAAVEDDAQAHPIARGRQERNSRDTSTLPCRPPAPAAAAPAPAVTTPSIYKPVIAHNHSPPWRIATVANAASSLVLGLNSNMKRMPLAERQVNMEVSPANEQLPGSASSQPPKPLTPPRPPMVTVPTSPPPPPPSPPQPAAPTAPPSSSLLCDSGVASSTSVSVRSAETPGEMPRRWRHRTGHGKPKVFDLEDEQALRVLRAQAIHTPHSRVRWPDLQKTIHTAGRLGSVMDLIVAEHASALDAVDEPMTIGDLFWTEEDFKSANREKSATCAVHVS